MDISQYKEVISSAIRNEIEAQEFYENVAQVVSDPYLKEMFNNFVEEEKKHEHILDKILTDAHIQTYFSSPIDTHVSETIKRPPLSLDMTPSDAIALAMKKEEDAMNEYMRLAEACSDSERKAVFLDLAEMERGHKAKMEAAFVDIGYPEVW